MPSPEGGTVTSPELELVWDGGSLDLMGENETPYGPVSFAALAEGTEWGRPESVRRALFSLLADGSASVTDRHDNRTVSVRLRLSAADSSALAGGEAPLHMLASKRRAELRWTPPNDYAAPAAFIVVASDLSHEMDDLGENRVERFYALTLVCRPFALSIEPVVIEALPAVSATPTVLDACTSTTGWSGSGATFSIIAGSVGISRTTAGTSGTSNLTKSIARTKRYLAVEVLNGDGGYFVWSGFRVNHGAGAYQPPLVGTDGAWRFYDVPASLGPISSITFLTTRHAFSTSNQLTGRVATIAESDVPALSAGRQSLRVIPAPGSARTDGSLLVESRDATDVGAGTALGQVIVYTGPQYDPRLSVDRGADVLTADTTALSGKRSATGTTHNFYRRASDLPDGEYAILASVKGTAGSVTYTLTVDAINPYTLGVLRTLQTVVATSTLVGTGYNLLSMGTATLPGVSTSVDTNIFLRFKFVASASVNFDEALIFNRTLGRLTVVDTRNIQGIVESPPGVLTTTTGATRVWLDAPALDRPARIMAGRTQSGSMPTSLASELPSWDGAPLFTPDATYLYVGTTEALDPKVAGTFRPAWHTHPAA